MGFSYFFRLIGISTKLKHKHIGGYIESLGTSNLTEVNLQKSNIGRGLGRLFADRFFWILAKLEMLRGDCVDKGYRKQLERYA